MEKLSLRLQHGFTLIELLVVIAIIGILASTVLAALNDSRSSARDARRLTEAKQLQTAVELSRNAYGNLYPCSNGSIANGSACSSTTGAQDVVLTGSSAPTNFLALINFTPSADPVYGGTSNGGLRYRVRSADGATGTAHDNPDRTSYTIAVRLENGRTNSAGNVIPAGGWCSISIGAGHHAWNNSTAGSYYPCF